MIAVVTGASGFIGRNLVEQLLSRGAEVRCLVRARGGRPPERAAAFPVDFAEQETLDRCDAFDGADVVFHLAGATRATSQRRFDRANVATTHALLRAIEQRRAGARFVYVSSQSAAGPARAADQPAHEDDAPAPVEAYGRSKLAAERVIEGFSRRVASTIVRPSAVFGPWDRGFHSMFRAAALGWLVYPSVQHHWMSVVHVDDVAEGMINAAMSPSTIGRTYFLGSDVPVTWGSFGQLIVRAMGREAREWNVPFALVRGVCEVGEWAGRLTGTTPLMCRSRAVLAQQEFWVCSSARARSEFGFRTTRLLPDAVHDTYLWYVRNGWLRGPEAPPSNA